MGMSFQLAPDVRLQPTTLIKQSLDEQCLILMTWESRSGKDGIAVASERKWNGAHSTT